MLTGITLISGFTKHFTIWRLFTFIGLVTFVSGSATGQNVVSNGLSSLDQTYRQHNPDTFLAYQDALHRPQHPYHSLTKSFQQTISSSGPYSYPPDHYTGRSSAAARKGIRFDDDTLSKYRPGISKQPGFNPQLMTQVRARPVEYPENDYIPNYSFGKKNHHGIFRHSGTMVSNQQSAFNIIAAYRRYLVGSCGLEYEYYVHANTGTNRPPTTTMNPKKCGIPGAGPVDRLVSSQATRLLRIVGGFDAVPNQICWQAKVSINRNAVCGGSIIGKRTILTASHCVIDDIGLLKDPKTFTVQVGAMDSNVTEQTKDPKSCFQELKVVKLTPNSDFDTNLTRVNNIALLTLDADIDFSKPCACPICLRPWIPIPGEVCAVSGYGAELFPFRDPAPLKVAQVNIVQTDFAHCLTLDPANLNPLANLNDLLCAGDIGGQGPCYRDGGGPLVCFDEETRSHYQVGITSYGKSCLEGFGVYTRVSSYLDWIRRNTQDNSVPFC